MRSLQPKVEGLKSAVVEVGGSSVAMNEVLVVEMGGSSVALKKVQHQLLQGLMARQSP